MKINKLIIFITIIIITSLIIFPTVYKINKNHQNALMEVLNKEVTETAIECRNVGQCKNDKITLRELYDLSLLDKVINPITKEVISESSYVKIVENKASFIIED